MIGLSFCLVAVPVAVKIMVGTRLVGLLPEVFLSVLQAVGMAREPGWKRTT